MDFIIRNFKQEDKPDIISMMNTFYSGDAVSTNGSPEIFEKNFEECLKSEILEGYVFTDKETILGYSMLAKSFSTEFGKICYWFEDFYLKPEYRGQHIIPHFIEYIKNFYPNVIFKLEADRKNAHALYVYKKCGFRELPYIELML